MDGHTVARMRLLERTNAELQGQNTYMSHQVLRMSEQVDKAAKASHVDRLLTAALVEFILGRESLEEGWVELQIADVDAMKAAIASSPGLSVIILKDNEQQVWRIGVKANEPTDAPAVEPEGAKPSLIVMP